MPANVLDTPPRQRCERSGLIVGALRQLLTVLDCGRTCVGAVPGMTQHIACLKTRAIGGFLKDEVFGKVRIVIAHVQTRQKYLLKRRPRKRPAGRPKHGWRPGPVEPEHTKTAEFL